MANQFPTQGSSNFSSITFQGISAGYVTHSAPATVTSYQLVWPNAQASAGQQLQNDGAGNLSWADAAGGAVTTMGAFGSTPNANGGSIASDTLTLQPASATQPGGVSILAQAFAGNKNFTGLVAVASAIDANSQFYVSGGSGLAAGNQRGINVDTTFNASATSASVIRAQGITAASAILSNLHVFNASGVILGSGSTVTSLVEFFSAKPTVGANNACLADNNVTGNWFINQTGTTDSLFSGRVGIGPNADSIGSQLLIRNNQNARTRSIVNNTNAGAAANVQFSLSSNADDWDFTLDSTAGGADATINAGAGITGGLSINAQAGAFNLKTAGSTRLSISNAGVSTFSGDVKLGTAGNGLYVKEGTNATMGTGTLNGATEVTISTTKVTANSRIFLSIQSPAGTPAGAIYVSSRSAGVSFGVKGLALDTSTFAWLIVEPA